MKFISETNNDVAVFSVLILGLTRKLDKVMHLVHLLFGNMPGNVIRIPYWLLCEIYVRKRHICQKKGRDLVGVTGTV